jgi:hypothetical protein
VEGASEVDLSVGGDHRGAFRMGDDHGAERRGSRARGGRA